MHLILGSTIPDINDAVDERDGKLCKFFLLNWIYLTVSFIFEMLDVVMSIGYCIE